MGLYRFAPEPSGRMGILWTVGAIGEAAVLEFGSMGHTLYSEKWMGQTGIRNRAKIFATHIDEKEIALGITKRFEDAIEEIVTNIAPKAIFILPSTIPQTIGMDIEAICEEIQYRYEDIPIITFQKGGFREKLHDGIEEGLYQVVKNIPIAIDKSKTPTFNIIGSCPDFARFEADVAELQRLLKGSLDMEVSCILSSDTSISQIKEMGQAHINLVIRKEGIKAAKELQQKFDTPYIVGRPYGFEGTTEWIKEIAKCLHRSFSETFILDEIEESQYQVNYFKQMLYYNSKKANFLMGSHYNIVEGMSKFAVEELGLRQDFIWCEQKSFATKDIPYQTEEEWLKLISNRGSSIIMGNNTLVNQTTRNQNFIVTRGLNSWNFNPYVSPFVGYRGARNLCDLWLQFLLDS